MTKILYPKASRVNRKPFGLGVLPPREKPAPYTLDDARWWAENSPAAPDAPADAWADEFGRRTLSPTEYAILRMEETADRIDRELDARDAELSELGIRTEGGR